MKSILLPLAAAISLGSTSCTQVYHADIYPNVRDRCASVLNNGFPGPSGVVLGANGTNSYYSTGEWQQPLTPEEVERLR